MKTLPLVHSVGRVRINFFLQMVLEQVNLIHGTPAYGNLKKNAKSLHPNTQAEKVVDYADTMSAESLHYADTMLVLPLTNDHADMVSA